MNKIITAYPYLLQVIVILGNIYFNRTVNRHEK